MPQTLAAVYENGVFRPLTNRTLGLSEGQHVRITLETNSPSEMLALAAQVYSGLAESEVDEVEKSVLDRSSFFTGRKP